VTHVVDAGYVKELRFDPANDGNSSLQEVFISRAAAQQRAGTFVCFIIFVAFCFYMVHDFPFMYAYSTSPETLNQKYLSVSFIYAVLTTVY